MANLDYDKMYSSAISLHAMYSVLVDELVNIKVNNSYLRHLEQVKDRISPEVYVSEKRRCKESINLTKRSIDKQLYDIKQIKL